MATSSKKESKDQGKSAVDAKMSVLNYLLGSHSPDFAKWRETASNYILSIFGEISSVFETGILPFKKEPKIDLSKLNEISDSFERQLEYDLHKDAVKEARKYN